MAKTEPGLEVDGAREGLPEEKATPREWRAAGLIPPEEVQFKEAVARHLRRKDARLDAFVWDYGGGCLCIEVELPDSDLSVSWNTEEVAGTWVAHRFTSNFDFRETLSTPIPAGWTNAGAVAEAIYEQMMQAAKSQRSGRDGGIRRPEGAR